MRFSIKTIEAYGLYNRFDLKVNLREDINVLYGRNGSGKTTLLHILANILNGSIDRFLILLVRIKLKFALQIGPFFWWKAKTISSFLISLKYYIPKGCSR